MLTGMFRPLLVRVLVLLLGGGLGIAASFAAGPAPATPAVRTLVVLGDSLTAGYGLEPDQAYPALLQRWIRDARLPFEVVNAGVSGDTTAGGLRRLRWLLQRRVDVLLVALGGNDGLRGIPPASTRSNLLSIVDAARERQPGIRVVLAGMRMPPNLGPEYVQAFEDVFPTVARERRVTLVPHLLEGVGGVPELNQADQIHPTAEGQRWLATNVWRVVRKELAEPPAQAP